MNHRLGHVATLVASAGLLSALACRRTVAPDTVPLTFRLAFACPALDLDRSWTFVVDDKYVTDATIRAGESAVVQVCLGSHEFQMRWNRTVGAGRAA